MNRPPSIPFSIIRELRCRNCENVVSCGPVYVIPDENIFCGRCRHLAKNIYQNIAFEALASMFIYPCQHWEDHCPRILQWNECFSHEDGCSYSGSCNLFWKHPKAYLKGKREMPYGDIRLIPVPEHLLDDIKCALCESYLSCEPVYIQPGGKNVCHRCIHSNGIPADCLRNLSYETLSNIIIFPCVFRNRGCPTRLKFGSELWHHEAECSYNQMYKKPEKKPNQKERGVIKTHWGHHWGTITPHSVPFAPPSPTSDFDINKELVKSLKKQQERKMLKAEEINSNFRKNSEDGSLDDSSEGGSDTAYYEKSLTSESTTPAITPGTTPGPTPLPLISRMDEPDSRSQYSNPPPTIFNFNNVKSNGSNYYDNIYLSQFSQDSDGPRDSRNSSFSKHLPKIHYEREDYGDNYKSVSRPNSYGQTFYEPVLYKNSSGPRSPLQDLDYNLLAGHYPIFTNPYGQGLIPKPSFKGVVRTDSLSSNRELIQELRLKQNKLKNKNGEKKEPDSSPYKECKNLDDILQVIDKISE